MTVIVSYEDIHNNTGCCKNSLKVEHIFFLKWVGLKEKPEDNLF